MRARSTCATPRRSRAAVERARPSVVLHLAAQPLVRRSYAAPAETFAVNVQGTAHVLDAVRAAGGVEAVVVVTSDKCYAPGRPRTGATARRTRSAATTRTRRRRRRPSIVAAAYRASYGAAARDGAGRERDRRRRLGRRPAAARRHGAPRSTGAPVELRNPEAVRPWQHVLNPLAGYLLLAQALAAGPGRAEGWNFGPDLDEALPVRRARRADRGAVGRRARGRRRSRATTRTRPRRCASTPTRARLRLGWRPAWDLDEGLRAIVEWYRAYERGADLREVTLAQIAAYQAAARRHAELAP